MERLDSILKSVAGSSTVVSVESAAEDTSDRLIVTKSVKQEQETVKAEPEVRSRNVSGSEHDDDRKKQRRDRNRQAAARCRKRRLDLTCALQVCCRILKTVH